MLAWSGAGDVVCLLRKGGLGLPGQALAEKEGEGMAKMIYRKDSGEILGVHILGLHAADLIHEASNAVATKQRVQARSLPLPSLCSPMRLWVPACAHAALACPTRQVMVA